MANIKQQKKRILTNEKRHALVSSFKASVKTAMKAVYAAVENKNLEAAVNALNFANKKHNARAEIFSARAPLYTEQCSGFK